MGKDCTKEGWISFILRIAMASLFAMAAAGKFVGGLDNIVAQFIGMFQSTWLPAPLVSLYARLLPWAEAALAVWLVLGIRLQEAWISTAFVLISLAFGLMVVHEPTSSSLYIYILVACAGLYFSSYDTCTIEKWMKK